MTVINVNIAQLMTLYFQKGSEKIFIFDKNNKLLLMNDAAKQIIAVDTIEQLLTGNNKAICNVCRGYTSGEMVQTCRNCYMFENRRDKASFQVYFTTRNEGIKPF